MEDGLVRSNGTALLQKSCCLNPCCNGRWSRTRNVLELYLAAKEVLILVVMEDGLVLDLIRPY